MIGAHLCNQKTKRDTECNVKSTQRDVSIILEEKTSGIVQKTCYFFLFSVSTATHFKGPIYGVEIA
jgi:hypothetical protein